MKERRCDACRKQSKTQSKSKSKSIKCLNDQTQNQNESIKPKIKPKIKTQNQNQSVAIAIAIAIASSPHRHHQHQHPKRDAHTFAFDPARKTGEYVSADIIKKARGRMGMEWEWNGGRAEPPNQTGGAWGGGEKS